MKIENVEIPKFLEKEITKENKSYLEAILKAKPRDNWYPAIITDAIFLADTYVQVFKLKQEIEKIGYYITSKDGNIRANPLITQQDLLSKRIVNFSRVLQINSLNINTEKTFSASEKKAFEAENIETMYKPIEFPNTKVN